MNREELQAKHEVLLIFLRTARAIRRGDNHRLVAFALESEKQFQAEVQKVEEQLELVLQPR